MEKKAVRRQDVRGIVPILLGQLFLLIWVFDLRWYQLGINTVGYGLTIWGVSQLVRYHKSFKRAVPCLAFMAVWDVFWALAEPIIMRVEHHTGKILLWQQVISMLVLASGMLVQVYYYCCLTFGLGKLAYVFGEKKLAHHLHYCHSLIFATEGLELVILIVETWVHIPFLAVRIGQVLLFLSYLYFAVLTYLLAYRLQQEVPVADESKSEQT